MKFHYEDWNLAIKQFRAFSFMQKKYLNMQNKTKSKIVVSSYTLIILKKKQRQIISNKPHICHISYKLW